MLLLVWLLVCLMCVGVAVVVVVVVVGVAVAVVSRRCCNCWFGCLVKRWQGVQVTSLVKAVAMS
jgi:hypothetical protein